MTKPSFVYVTYIATTPEKLWRALTEGTFTEQYWFGTRIACDWAPGAPLTFRKDGALFNTGEVLVYDPYRRLSYTWKVEIDDAFRGERASRVVFDLEPKGAEVKLTLTHDDFDIDSKVHEAVSQGWPMVLASLKSFLETGRGLAVSSAGAANDTKEQVIARARAASR